MLLSTLFEEYDCETLLLIAGFGVSSGPIGSSSVFGSSNPSSGGVSVFGGTSNAAFNTNSSTFGSESPFTNGALPVFGFQVSSGCSSPFGSSSLFGQNSPSGAFGQNSSFGSKFTLGSSSNDVVGSKNADYTSSADIDGKLQSISVMPANKDKSHEELRWENYQSGDKGSSYHEAPTPMDIDGSPELSNSFFNSTCTNPPLFTNPFVSFPPQSSSNPFAQVNSYNPFARNSIFNPFAPERSQNQNPFPPRISQNQNPFGPRIPENRNPFGPRIPENRNPFGPRIPENRNPFGPRIHENPFGPRIHENPFAPESSQNQNLFPPTSSPESSFRSPILMFPSTLTGRPHNSSDRHRELRLNVDNMSYEELRELCDKIGYAKSGLKEDEIDGCLRKTKLCDNWSLQVQKEKESKCCICLEEYKLGDEVGKLECGHFYHTTCIKRWLVKKNVCPICKTAVGRATK